MSLTPGSPNAQTGGRVGIVGTFDVENYGDLLFPMLAEKELRARYPRAAVVAFSPNGRSTPEWPFDVVPLDTLPRLLPSLAGLLIGGGQIVRFDGTYPIAAPPTMTMPTGYWLGPALLAASEGRPVIWNAVGAYTDSPRAPWHHRAAREAFAASALVGIRDRTSSKYLSALGLAPASIQSLVPDTAFALSRLWPPTPEAGPFAQWRARAGLTGRYVVIQGSDAITRRSGVVRRHLQRIGVENVVIVPVCRCHGDRADIPLDVGARVFRTEAWPHPALIRDIIANADMVFASSLHASITALSYGVPLAWARLHPERKFEMLDGFEGVADIDDAATVERLGRRQPRIERAVLERQEQLASYWDRVGRILFENAPPIMSEARRATLRGLIPNGQERKNATLKERLYANVLDPYLTLRRRRVSYRDRLRARIAALLPGKSRSTQADASPHRSPILRVDRISSEGMADSPYRWGAIDELFAPADAASLAEEFPRERFRSVEGNDGEKSYRYWSRSIVHMGATEPTHAQGLSPAWQRLAADLLSIEYRDALSRATGLDLTHADMEINAIHYGPGSWLGPHLDLREKIVTHILYFNASWQASAGGCLSILRSQDQADREAEILPIVGNSALLVRSDRSWHSVSAVNPDCTESRRSLNVIFHLPGSKSTMWPPGARHKLQPYET